MPLGKIWGAMACVVGCATFASADEKQSGKEQEQQEIVVKAEKVQKAKFIDFGSELGLPLAALDSLGDRIDGARLEADPVELASIAKYLEAAESTAKKKASLTSETLIKEAVALARLRNDLTELEMVAKLVGGPASKELLAIVEAAKAAEKSEENEEERLLTGRLRVRNYGFSEVYVRANGLPLGVVPPRSEMFFNVFRAFYIDVRDRFGNQWGADLRWQDRAWYVMHIPPFGPSGGPFPIGQPGFPSGVPIPIN